MKIFGAFFIGDVALDEYYSTGRYPSLREKVSVIQMQPEMGGMIANAACVYASYGSETSFISLLNSNDIQLLCPDLNSHGIDTSFVARDDSLPDSKCIILLAENEHSVLIVERKVDNFEISAEAHLAICASNLVYSNYVELRHLSCGNKDSEDLLADWKSSGVFIACDIDVEKIDEQMKSFLKYTDCLFMNEIGFENLVNEGEPEQSINSVLNAGVEILVVTLADKGCTIYTKSGKTKVDGISVPVVDVTGAGDTFNSSFVYAYLKSRDIFLSGEFANYAAAASITEIGARAGSKGLDHVLSFIQSREIDISRFKVLER